MLYSSGPDPPPCYDFVIYEQPLIYEPKWCIKQKLSDKLLGLINC